MFGLYIHWPFCQSKCPYCDFNSHVRAQIDEQQWCDGLLRELKYVGEQTRGRLLTSVFFGGGTPSLMSATTVEALISQLNQYWTLDPNLEITLEANPNSIEAQKFRDFKQAGINRVSIGVQALNDPDLKFLGRLHGRDEALAAIDIAQKIFDNFSFDLIYARPQQTLDDWAQELREAINLCNYHLSVYQLTIEQGTAFHTAHQRGDWHIPDNDLAGQFYEQTQQILQQHGLAAYEISNHARLGFECQHNLVYWRYQDYACIGPGAHGRLTFDHQKRAIKNYKLPETWLNAVQTCGHGQEEITVLNAEEQLTECLMMGLRLTQGIPLSRLSNFYPTQHIQHLADIFSQQSLESLINAGYLYDLQTTLKLTSAGMQRMNAVLKFLLEHNKLFSN